MHKSLILLLPDIVNQGLRQASHFLSALEGRHEPASSRIGHALRPVSPGHNHLVCGDDLGVLVALLAGDHHLPKLHARVKLICFDPCMGEPAAGSNLRSATEQLVALSVRLLLMRALLADTGFICVKLAHPTAPGARLVVDTVFGTENNAQDILWQTPPSQRMASTALRHGLMHIYTKHRRRMEPALPDSTAHRQPSSCAAEAMLRHLLAVTTAPGDTVVSFNAAEEIASVASTSPRQWIIATPDTAVGDALDQRMADGCGRSFLRHALPASCRHQQAPFASR
ncbi:MAG: hypothetical protein C0453_02150 [Comamonadaceae bacterium]|nr:hypothetical protein [Comamonadaceae bacterium]